MITEAGWSLLTGPGVRSMFHETVFGDVEPMTRIRLVRGGEKSRPHATETKTHGSAWRCGASGDGLSAHPLAYPAAGRAGGLVCRAVGTPGPISPCGEGGMPIAFA